MDEQQVKIVDCTIRDGGLMNNWQFPHETVRQLYLANQLAKVDYMEMGYKSSPELFSPAEYGVWKFCNEEDLKIVTEGLEADLKLAMMIDIGRCRKEEILPSSQSLIHTLRLACYVHQAAETIAMAQHCVALGYECFINIMAVSTADREVVKEFLYKIEEDSGVTGVYVSDTFGSFTLQQVTELVKLYKSICRSKVIGFHGHNNQQLALANTLLAREAGACYLDATCFGMGRGAGNCPLELLLPQLRKEQSELSGILNVIEKHIEPLIPEYKWGYHIPYALTGITNNHPRAAISFIGDKQADYAAFYANMQRKN